MAEPPFVPGEYISSMRAFAETLTSVRENLIPVAEVFREINKKETGKTLKSFKEGLKELRETVKDAALEGLADIFRPLKGIFEPLKPIIEILSGTMGVFIGEILKAIMPAMQPIFDLLLQLMPIFKTLGAAVGKAILWVFDQLKAAWDAIVNFWTVTMKPVWDALEQAWQNIVDFWNDNIVPIWDAVVEFFTMVYDWLVDLFSVSPEEAEAGAAAAAEVLVKSESGEALSQEDLLKYMIGSGFAVLGSAQGGAHVERAGPVNVHAGEEILSAGIQDQMLDELARSRRATERLLDVLESERRWNI